MYQQAIGPEEVRDLVVESLNGRDPELLAEAELGASSVVDTLRFAEERFPRMVLTRGDLNGEPVAVIWMPNTDDTFVQSGHLEFVVTRDDDVEMEIFDGIEADLVAESPSKIGVTDWVSGEATQKT